MSGVSFGKSCTKRGSKGRKIGDCRDYMGVVLPGPSLADFALQLSFK